MDKQKETVSNPGTAERGREHHRVTGGADLRTAKEDATNHEEGNPVVPWEKKAALKIGGGKNHGKCLHKRWPENTPATRPGGPREAAQAIGVKEEKKALTGVREKPGRGNERMRQHTHKRGGGKE